MVLPAAKPDQPQSLYPLSVHLLLLLAPLLLPPLAPAFEALVACQCHDLGPYKQFVSSAEKHPSNAGAQLRLASLAMVRVSLLVTAKLQVNPKHLALGKPTATVMATAAAGMCQMHQV